MWKDRQCEMSDNEKFKLLSWNMEQTHHKSVEIFSCI
jgi:hypothetical protein